MNRKLRVSIFRYVWEFADAMERLPESLPADMNNRVKGGAIGGVLGYAIGCIGYMWWLGPILPAHVLAILWVSAWASVIPAAMGLARGWHIACAGANIKALEWKRAQLGEREPTPLLTEH